MIQRLNEIAEQFGTPCYVYDEALVRRNAERFLSIPYQNKQIHVASMANDNPELLGIVKRAGVGIFVNSMKHLVVALQAGFSRDEVIYTTTGMSRADLRLVARSGFAVNLDSLEQLATLGEIAPGTSIGVRLNIDEKSRINTFIGMESRIGILPSEFDKLLQLAKKYDIRITGTHVYLGTDIVNEAEMLEGTRRTLEMSKAFPDLEYVDVGGGFPVGIEAGGAFDYPRYRQEVTTLFEDYSRQLGKSIKLVLEPGRSMFADAGVFCTRVLEVKERPDRYLVNCDASVSVFPRPMIYNVYHPVDVDGRAGAKAAAKPADIVGSTTYSRDFLAKGVSLPEVKPGALLVFKDAGSYCYSLISRFLGQSLPGEVLVGLDGTARSIRMRERWDLEAQRLLMVDPKLQLSAG